MRKLFALNLLVLVLASTGMLQAQKFTNFTTLNGLPSDAVYGVAIDGNNVKWFATLSGVAKFNDTSWTVYKTAQGLIDTITTCIAADSKNNIWVGTYSGASKFNGTAWTSYTTADGLVNDMINYIMEDKEGYIWFATNNGLSRFDGTNWKNFTSSGGLPADMISCLACDDSNNIWIGTMIGGLVRYNGTAFKTYTTADSVPENNINAVTTDSLEYKYIGTYSSGMGVFNALDQWVKNYRESDGLYNNYVQDLVFDHKHNLWIGTYDDYHRDGAITRFDGSEFVSYTVSDGLVGEHVKRLAVDQANNLWIATTAGVSKFTDKNLGVETLSSGECRIYPNPARDKVYISFSLPLNITVTDITGNKVLGRYLTSPETGMDVSMLRPGIYVVSMSGNGKNSVSKLVIL